MEDKRKPRLLCVDDEPDVLDGLVLNLRRRYDVLTATSGAAGLEVLGRETQLAAVISDMRMPGMDGATFLAEARKLAPTVTRLLLTGQTDLEAAIRAVNQGQIFRFLSKPCLPPDLLLAVEAAVEQHRLLTSERVLLEQTLHGCIKALTDVLSMSNPDVFGRATRLKRSVGEMAARLARLDTWQVEVAAMFSQMPFITLPPETLTHVYYGLPLSPTEQKMVERLPLVLDQLLAPIPRLEDVRAILMLQHKGYKKAAASVNSAQLSLLGAAQLLKVASDYDALEMQGNAASLAIATMRGRLDLYDPIAVDALAEVKALAQTRDEIRVLPLAVLRAGMVLAEDLKTNAGMLIVARGYEVTAHFVEKAQNFQPGTVAGPVRVLVKSSGALPASSERTPTGR